MKIKNQLGFSVLHALPVVALLAVVAVTGVRLMNGSHAATSSYSISCMIMNPQSITQGTAPVTAELDVMDPYKSINAQSGTVREQVSYKEYVGSTLISTKAVAATTPAVGAGTYITAPSTQILTVNVPGVGSRTGTWKLVMTPHWQRYANGKWTTFVTASCSKSAPIQSSSSSYSLSCSITGPSSVKLNDMANDIPVKITIKNTGKSISAPAGTYAANVGATVSVGSSIVTSGTSWPTTPAFSSSFPSGTSQTLTMGMTGPGNRPGTWSLTLNPYFQYYNSSNNTWPTLVGTSCKFSAPIVS